MGRSQAAVQLSFSAYVLCYGAFQLLYRPLSDRHGRRSVLMEGLLLAGLGSVLAALADSLDALVFARALQGVGSAAGMVVGRSAVQDLFEGTERTRVMAYIGMTLGLCPPAAALIGGQLHVHLGWQASFVLMAALSLLLIAARRGLPAPSRQPVRDSHWLVDMGRAYAGWRVNRPSGSVWSCWPRPRRPSMPFWRARPSCCAAMAWGRKASAGTSWPCRCPTPSATT